MKDLLYSQVLQEGGQGSMGGAYPGSGTTGRMGTQETEDPGQGPLRGGGGVQQDGGVFMGALGCH